MVLSSGLHGVEGFFGSAVQLAFLQSELFAEVAAANCRLVLLHGLNPYGFAQLRRVNEDNVDLNRNFLLPNEAYAGSPELYRHVDGWLNPRTPPRRAWPIPLRGVVDLLRYGTKKLFSAIPAGQYDFPQGLFFGGRKPCQTTRLVQQHMADWLGDAQQIVHLDFHTGLGAHGTYKLLLDAAADDPQTAWFSQQFGEQNVSTLPASRTDLEVRPATRSQSYVSRGSFGHWCRRRFSERDYHFATAEFGTYAPLRVLLALRAENRAHHWTDDPAEHKWAKRQLVEMFAPASKSWREQVVRAGIDLIWQASRHIAKA